MPTPNRPVFTDTYESVDAFRPNETSVYVWGSSVEDRSRHLNAWRADTRTVTFIEITGENRSNISCKIDGTDRQVALRSATQMAAFWNEIKKNTVYLDITGMRHHAWAALLRGALQTREHVVVIYVEPRDYRQSLTPTENEIYDLSDRIEGIAPLPGFANLQESGDNSCFVPLLGFEGTRAAFLLSQLEPPGGKIFPIIGLPGFRPEYPFSAYLGNRAPLWNSQSWKKVRFAAGNCPFDAYYTLSEISSEYPNHVLKIAPIGTKPHAVGGVLYAIANPRQVELVYDHPVRKKRRTEGTANLHAYHVSALFR